MGIGSLTTSPLTKGNKIRYFYLPTPVVSRVEGRNNYMGYLIVHQKVIALQTLSACIVFPSEKASFVVPYRNDITHVPCPTLPPSTPQRQQAGVGCLLTARPLPLGASIYDVHNYFAFFTPSPSFRNIYLQLSLIFGVFLEPAPPSVWTSYMEAPLWRCVPCPAVQIVTYFHRNESSI